MKTQEHLQKIKAKCQELLSIAEQRTQGKWIHSEGRRMCLYADSLHASQVLYGNEYELGGTDGDFIASCAGPAEAGWKSTIAAIEAVLHIIEFFESPPEHPLNQRELEIAMDVANAIIAAWPEELL